MKLGDLVKKKESYVFGQAGAAGLGIVVAVDSVDTAFGPVVLNVKVKWSGDYGTFLSPPQGLEVLSETR